MACRDEVVQKQGHHCLVEVAFQDEAVVGPAFQAEVEVADLSSSEGAAPLAGPHTAVGEPGRAAAVLLRA